MTTKENAQKQLVLQSLALLPEDATIEDAMERLYLLLKIQKGIEDIEAGRTHTQAEVEARMAKWLA